MIARVVLSIIFGLAGGVAWRRRKDGYVDPPKPYFDHYRGFR